MELRLHRNARTTPALRKAICASSLSHVALAKKLNLNVKTIQKWRKRGSEHLLDASSRPRQMHTTIPQWQEEIVAEIRRDLLLTVADLLVFVRHFMKPDMVRSSLQRLLHRHGVGNLRTIIAELNQSLEGEKKHKTFKDYEAGYLHVDVKYLPKMPDEETHGYVFVARDRATRWVYLAVKPNKTAEYAQEFLQELIAAFPGKITIILTDNGKEFTDRFCATGERTPTGNHKFDIVCKNNDIEHRLTMPFSPQTNGMVERFNGMIQQILDTTKFSTAKELHQTLENYCHHYNHQIHLRCLNHQTPIQALEKYLNRNLASPDN